MKKYIMTIAVHFLCLTVFLVTPASFAAKEQTQHQTNTSEQQSDIQLEDLQRFSNAIAQIQSYYIKTVDSKTLLNNAIKGMLEGLDPHSTYLDEQAYKNLMTSTTGKFSGLGIEIVPDHGIIKIISPIDDSPAAAAGLKAGDYIVEVDDAPVSEMSLQEAVDKMRGKPGTDVKLTIIRAHQPKPFEVTITRNNIDIQSVKSRLLEDSFAYVRVSQFQQDTEKKIQKALNELQKESKKPLKGLILDLRNNPGGLLQSAVGVSDLFLNGPDLTRHNKRIVFTKGRIERSNYDATATKGDALEGKPIIVLINEGSASASEIVAGALQDHKRAIIMGQNSFGKGSVQSVIPVGEKDAVKLTTSLYYTPSGREIQERGIQPDILIEELQLSKSDEAVVLQPLKEYKLNKHLKNTNGKKQATATISQSDLAQEDYALFEALSLLKAITVINLDLSNEVNT